MNHPRLDDARLREVGTAWFGDASVAIRPLDGDGFSGAPLAVATPADRSGAVVLKPFAAGVRPRVEWGHGLMRWLRSAGCREVPEVVVLRAGGTVAIDSLGMGWEAVRFVAGTATDAPSPAQACAAAAALARLHRAAAEWPAVPPTRGVAPAVTRRIAQAGRLLSAPWRMSATVAADDEPLRGAVAARLARAIAIAREAGLSAALREVLATAPEPVGLHAVLRDMWSGHVLFTDAGSTRIAGIVDYHAAAVDTPATDVARLLGSWRRVAPLPPDIAWPEALAAYEAVRPLPPAERRLVPWLDATGTILGLDNWFRWVLEEDRRFAGAARVLERIDRLIMHLPAAIDRVARRRIAV